MLAVFRNFVDWLPLHVVGVAAGGLYVLVVVGLFPILPSVGVVSGVGVFGGTVFVNVYLVSVLPGISFVGSYPLVIAVALLPRRRTFAGQTDPMATDLRLQSTDSAARNTARRKPLVVVFGSGFLRTFLVRMGVH